MIVTRLSPAVKAVVVRAYECAARDLADEISEEHLLEAVLADPDGRHLLGAPALPEVLLAQLAGELAESRSKGGLTAADKAVLTGLGIDVNTVVERIEEQFGAQSLASGPAKHRARWRKPVFSAGVLPVLAEVERHLSAAGERSLGVDQLVLAMVSAPGVLAESLAGHGITETTVRARLATRRAGGGAP
jgi:hypothetical protein